MSPHLTRLVAGAVVVAVMPWLWCHTGQPRHTLDAARAAGFLQAQPHEAPGSSGPPPPPPRSRTAASKLAVVSHDEASAAADDAAPALSHAAHLRPLLPIDIDALDFRYLSHAVIDEDRKLLICTIPKVLTEPAPRARRSR